MVYNLLIIGEAVKNVDEDLRARDTTVPWLQIAGMRDLLAHEYFRVDPKVIERTVRTNLVDLDLAVRRLRSSN